MDIIEFLQTTGQKNIKSYIGMKVQAKVLEYEAVLHERQQMLRDVFEFENMQYNEEIVELINEKLNEQFRKRLDWINTKCMERVKAEEELINLKNQQRELENCEEWRHLQSQQLLLDSKKGQLHQIEDRKLRIQNEKEIDKMWHEVMKRLSCEKEYQEIYKNKLLKVIERGNQLKNQEIDDNKRKQKEAEYQRTKKEFHLDDQKALYMEEKCRKDGKLKAFLNKTHYNQMLKTQISENFEKKLLETRLLLKEACLQKEHQDRNLFSELKQSERQKIYNNEWHKYYLTNALEQKKEKIEEENEYERMYLNTGCVLQRNPKKPYGKNTR